MVKWLRHRPFTAVTRVRVPVGSPNFNQRPLPRADFLFIIVFCGIIFGAGHRIIFQKQYRIESLLIYARVAELADALDLGSSGKPWGFKSLRAHQKKHRKVLFVCARRNLNLPLYQVPTCAPEKAPKGAFCVCTEELEPTFVPSPDLRTTSEQGRLCSDFFNTKNQSSTSLLLLFPAKPCGFVETPKIRVIDGCLLHWCVRGT
jgi:hypothetical protein